VQHGLQIFWPGLVHSLHFACIRHLLDLHCFCASHERRLWCPVPAVSPSGHVSESSLTLVVPAVSQKLVCFLESRTTCKSTWYTAASPKANSFGRSRFYRRSELAFRLSLYIVMAPLAGAFGGLLASAILKLDHFGGLHEWRMIFAIEGIITIGLAIISFFTLTDRPETARWLTQEEKDLAIARVKSERVATSEVLDKIDTPKILKGILSPVSKWYSSKVVKRTTESALQLCVDSI
jgi:MFS family permease